MASGSWTFGTKNSLIQGKVNWSSSSNGSSANSSNISVSVYFRRTNSGYTSSGKVNTYCVINGGSQKNETGFSVSMSNPNTWTLVYAKNWTVSHNSDGSKQINIRVWGNGNFSIGSYDTNKTVTLDKIPRYTSIRTWSVAEVGKTYVKLNWATADTVDWLCTYLNDSKAWTNITAEGGLNASSGSFVYVGMDPSGGTSIPSASTLKPNTKYKIKLWVRRKDSKLGTYSSNIEFTTSPVAMISNLTDGFSYNIGDNLVINFSNSSINKSWLSLEIENTSGVFEEILKTDEAIQSDSYTWLLSNYASTLFSKLSTRNSAKCKIKCGTTIVENGQTISYVVNEITGTINVINSNSNPIFYDFNYGNEDSVTQKILGNSAYMMQNCGSMVIRIPTNKMAVAKNGASIVKYVIQVRGVEYTDYERSASSSEISINCGSYYITGKGTISIYAVDSRGNTSQTVSKTFTVLPYSIPNFSALNLKRLNDYEAEIVLDFKARLSSLNVGGTEKNTIHKVGYRYTDISSNYPSSFTNINGASASTANSNITLSFAQNTQDNTFGITGSGSSKLILDNNKSYKFQFYLQDSYTTVYYETIIEQGVPIMFIGDNNQVSVGMIPDITRDEKFQVGSDILATNANGELVGILDLISKIIIPSDTEPESQPNGGFWLKTSTIGEENIVG